MDQLRVFRGKPCEVNSKISIRQPTLDEICDYGEQAYYGLVQTICSTPSDRKVEIWDKLHIFWDEMDEYALFLSMMESLQGVDTSILFGGLRMDDFRREINPGGMEVVLRNGDGVLIDRATHVLITDALRRIHRMKKNTDVGYDRYTKEVMIEDDREEMQKLRNKPYESGLVPVIATLTNLPGFKYRHDDVWTMPIGAFMTAVERNQRYLSHEHLMHGIYSGCVDMKKVSKRELNLFEELK